MAPPALDRTQQSCRRPRQFDTSSCFGDGDAHVPGVETWSFDVLLDEATPVAEFPEFDERTASSIWFSSGTTGLPKGVVYTHRSTVLHAMAISAPTGWRSPVNVPISSPARCRTSTAGEYHTPAPSRVPG